VDYGSSSKAGYTLTYGKASIMLLHPISDIRYLFPGVLVILAGSTVRLSCLEHPQ
jgi:hypothetical protein